MVQRQVPVIQKAPRIADISLLQYSDTTVDVPVAKTTHEKTPRETTLTKHNDIQMDKRAAFSIAEDREQEAECLRQ